MSTSHAKICRRLGYIAFLQWMPEHLPIINPYRTVALHLLINYIMYC